MIRKQTLYPLDKLSKRRIQSFDFCKIQKIMFHAGKNPCEELFLYCFSFKFSYLFFNTHYWLLGKEIEHGFKEGFLDFPISKSQSLWLYLKQLGQRFKTPFKSLNIFLHHSCTGPLNEISQISDVLLRHWFLQLLAYFLKIRPCKPVSSRKWNLCMH